jgi:hypothetical protein
MPIPVAILAASTRPRRGAPGAPGVHRGGIQQGAGNPGRAGQLGERPPGDGGMSGVGPGQSCDHAQSGGLAGAVAHPMRPDQGKPTNRAIR